MSKQKRPTGMRAFWIIWAGQVISLLGTSMTNFGLTIWAYEQTGERDKARKEYAFFVEAWEDADPELQPWVDDARLALDRLTADR